MQCIFFVIHMQKDIIFVTNNQATSFFIQIITIFMSINLKSTLEGRFSSTLSPSPSKAPRISKATAGDLSLSSLLPPSRYRIVQYEDLVRERTMMIGEMVRLILLLVTVVANRSVRQGDLPRANPGLDLQVGRTQLLLKRHKVVTLTSVTRCINGRIQQLL